MKRRNLLKLSVLILIISSSLMAGLTYPEEIINNGRVMETEKDLALEELYELHRMKLLEVFDKMHINNSLESKADYERFLDKYEDSSVFAKEISSYRNMRDKVEEKYWYLPLTEEKLECFIYIDEDYNDTEIDYDYFVE